MATDSVRLDSGGDSSTSLPNWGISTPGLGLATGMEISTGTGSCSLVAGSWPMATFRIESGGRFRSWFLNW